MRQRHVRVGLYLFIAFWFSTIVAWGLVMYHLRQQRRPPKFIDPIIWREPFTDGEEQLQPEI